MVIRLLPDQIEKVWEAIKYAYIKAGYHIKKEEIPQYLYKLLVNLLSNRAQCFIALSENRELEAILITKITEDNISGERTLFTDALYSFKKSTESEWMERLELLKEFARKSGCTAITSYSAVPQIFALLSSLGFEERFRCMSLKI